jgi:hypothetical protein
MPRVDDPAQPYWVVIAVTPEGLPTGEILGLREEHAPKIAGIAFFQEREDARSRATYGRRPPTQAYLGSPAEDVQWEVRGASKRFLRKVHADESLRAAGVVLVSRDSQGWVLTPIDPSMLARPRAPWLRLFAKEGGRS